MVRDFGFAPNPFHGACTLATCKPVLRRVARAGDWVFGVGGVRLGDAGRLIFGMNVSETMSFDQYWLDPRFQRKKPIRNGSLSTLVGDNIYHRDPASGDWIQADSHHSRPDGTADPDNIRSDTATDRVLIAKRFVYFGKSAISIPEELLEDLGYASGRGHRKYDDAQAAALLSWMESCTRDRWGLIVGEPHEFDDGAARYAGGKDKIVR